MSVIPSIILSAAISCGSVPSDVQGLLNTIEKNGCSNIVSAADIETLKDILGNMGGGCSIEQFIKDYINNGCQQSAPESPEEPEFPAEPESPEVPEITEAPVIPTAAPTAKPTARPTAKPTARPTARPTAKPTARPTVKPTQAPSSADSSSYAYQVIELVNKERAKYGLSALSADSTLMSAAQKRAIETVTSFSHTRPNGASFSSVLSEYNYSYRSAGENIAYGQRTPEEVVKAWMNSSGHRANILNGSYTKIGVGCYKSGSTYYWSQLFAG